MNEEKHKQELNSLKFNRITFAVDYIRQIQHLQNELKIEDFVQTLHKFYDDAFNDGRMDVLDRTVAQMFGEIDDIEDRNK